MIKKLQSLLARMDTLPEEDKEFIHMLQKESVAIENFNSMKATEGWRFLSSKIREEIASLINDAVKTNDRVQVLLGILATVETKEASQLLAEEIDKIIPNS
jgi:hypothetical protein